MKDLNEILKPEEEKDFTPWALLHVQLKGSCFTERFVAVGGVDTSDGVLNIIGAWYDDYEAHEGNPKIRTYMYAPGEWLSVDGVRWSEEDAWDTSSADS